MKKMKKGNALRIVLMCLFGLTFLFSAYKLVGIFTEYKTGSDEYDQLRFDVVTENVAEEEKEQPEDEFVTSVPELSQEETQVEMGERAPISVDFAALSKINPDVVGWIYSEGTPINYPIVRGKDNNQYLRRTIRKEYNNAGSIFMDYRNAPDFTDVFSVIYGHNLYTQEMFGSLLKYKKEGYYEEHSTLWLLTPDGDYKLRVLSGFTLDAASSLYEFGMTEERIENFLTRITARSDFEALDSEDPVKNLLVLSTCSYEYDDARYILVTSMEPMDP